MELWKVLLIVLLSAVLLGSVIGVLTGKHAVKKSRLGYKPLLSGKERLIYSLCVVAGVVFIVVGIVLVPSQPADGAEAGMDGGMFMEGETDMEGLEVETGEMETFDAADTQEDADAVDGEGDAEDADALEEEDTAADNADEDQPATSAGSAGGGGAVIIGGGGTAVAIPAR